MPPQHCCILLLGNVSNILKHKQLSESFLSQIPRQLLEARDFPKPQEHDLSLPKLPPAIQCSKVEDQTIDDIKTDDRVCTSSQKPSGEHLPASIQTFNGLVRHPVNATPVHSNFARCLPAFRCHSNDSNAWWKIWKAVVGPTRHFFSFRSHWHCAFYTLGMLAFIAQAMPGVWCAMHILCTGITPLVCLNTKGLSEVFSEKPKLTILCPVYLQFFKCVMLHCFFLNTWIPSKIVTQLQPWILIRLPHLTDVFQPAWTKAMEKFKLSIHEMQICHVCEKKMPVPHELSPGSPVNPWEKHHPKLDASRQLARPKAGTRSDETPTRWTKFRNTYTDSVFLQQSNEQDEQDEQDSSAPI